MFDFPFPITCFDRMSSPAAHTLLRTVNFRRFHIIFPPCFATINRNPPIDTLRSVSFTMLPHMSRSLFLLLISTIVLYFFPPVSCATYCGTCVRFSTALRFAYLVRCLSELGRGPHPPSYYLVFVIGTRLYSNIHKC